MKQEGLVFKNAQSCEFRFYPELFTKLVGQFTQLRALLGGLNCEVQS